MNSDQIRQIGETADAALQCQGRPPHRILVVEDEPTIRKLNAELLVRHGYDVDAVEDGAVAWDTLQVKSYDLLITDNSMPKVTGVELIEKVRAAGMALPVVMATATLPLEEFARRPWLQPAATLVKPYTLAELLAAVKNVLCAAVPTAMLLFCLPAAVNAQNSIQPPSGLHVVSSDNTPRTNAAQPHAVRPHAVAVTVSGKCDHSEDGVTFTNLESGQILEQGAIVRTSQEARADLFFRRTGTTVRLQAGTEVKLEKIAVTVKDGLSAEHILLDLRTGRICTVVRSRATGSSLEIRNAAGRSVVEGRGVGRYIITADGTDISAAGSVVPLKLMGVKGITTIAAGQQFTRQDGKLLPLSRTAYDKDLVQLEELQGATDRPAGRPSPMP